MTNFDVLIIGLGPIGKALALFISQSRPSTRVGILDANDGDHSKIQPRYAVMDDELLRLFVQRLGFIDEFIEKCALCHTMHMVTEWSEGAKLLFGLMENHGRPGAWASPKLPRDIPGRNGVIANAVAFWSPTLEVRLFEMLKAQKNVTILTNNRVVGVTQDEERVRVTVERAEGRWKVTQGQQNEYEYKMTGEKSEISCSYLVGADGSSSTIRNLCFPRLATVEYESRWYANDVLIPDHSVLGRSLPSYCQFIVSQKRNIVLVPSTKSDPATKGCIHYRIDFEGKPDDDPTYLASPAGFAELIASLGLVLGTDVILVRSSPYTARGLVLPQWRNGRVFLAGDSAHSMPPHMGQGMCQGIRDANALAWRLNAVLAGVASQSCLDTYFDDRYPQAKLVVEMSCLVEKMADSYLITGQKPDLTAYQKMQRASLAAAASLRMSKNRPGDVLAGRFFPQFVLPNKVRSDDILFSKSAIATLVIIVGKKGQYQENKNISQDLVDIMAAAGGRVVKLEFSQISSSSFSRVLENCDACLVLWDRMIVGSANWANDGVKALVHQALAQELFGTNLNVAHSSL